MSRPREFDRFMVDMKIGTNRKLRLCTPAQRWVYVAGVLALAAQAPIRGALLVAASHPATTRDIADEASVSLHLASTSLERFRSLGLIEDGPDGHEVVHDWRDWNPPPRSNSRAGERERKRDQRARPVPGEATA